MSYNIFLRNHLSLLSFQSIFLHLQSFSMDKYKAIFHETLKLVKNAGTTERDGRNDAKRLCTNVVTVSDEVKPKKRKMQGKAEYSRRTVCKSLPKKM